MSNLLPGQLFNVPEFPNAFDDEFDGFTLDPKWTIEGNLVATAVSLDAAVAAGDLRLSVGQRPSWIRFQAGLLTGPPADHLGIHFEPDPGNELPDGTYWCRYAPSWRRVTQVNGDCTVLLCLADGSSTSQWRDEWIGYGINLDPGEAQRELKIQEGGGDTTVAESTTLHERGEAHEYLALIKTGLSFQAWSASAAGSWQRRATGTYGGGGVIDSLGLRVGNNTSVDPGSAIQAFDFIRYRADGQLP